MVKLVYTPGWMGAAENGEIEKMKKYLAEGKITDVNVLTHDNMSALQYAAQEGHLDIVQMLVELGADVNHVSKMPYPSNSLGTAAFYGHLDIMQYLIEHNAAIHGSDKAWSPLAQAAISSSPHNIAAIDMLIAAGADVNETKHNTYACFESRYSVLHQALIFGSTNAAHHLIEQGALPNKKENLWEVIAQGGCVHDPQGSYAPFVPFLIEHGYDCNAPHGSIDTRPIHLAAHYGNLEVMNALLDAGAQTHHITRGIVIQNVWSYAAESGHQPIVQLLIDRGHRP